MKTQAGDEEKFELGVDSLAGWNPWVATRPLALGGEAYVLRWYEPKPGKGRKLHRKQFRDLPALKAWVRQEAQTRKKEAHLIAKKEKRGDNAVTLMNLTPSERAALASAIEKIRSAGGKVETITEAARVFAETHLQGAKTTVAELLAEHLEALRKQNKKPPTIRDRRLYLESFIEAHGDTLAAAITSAQVEDWVFDADTPSKQASRRRAASALFTYGMKRGVVTRNPVATVERPAELGPESVAILKPGEVEAVLRAAQTIEPRMSAYFAVGFFAGLRPQNELGRLDWAQINLKEGGKITVTKRTAKTTKTRHPPIAPNLRAWLEAVPKADRQGPLFYSRRAFRRILDAACVDKNGCPAAFKMEKGKPVFKDAAKLKAVKWGADIMRHCYASYRQEQIKNIPQLVSEMGNTIPVAEAHYVNTAIEGDDLKAFWGILPTPSKRRGE